MEGRPSGEVLNRKPPEALRALQHRPFGFRGLVFRVEGSGLRVSWEARNLHRDQVHMAPPHVPARPMLPVPWAMGMPPRGPGSLEAAVY